MQDTYCLTTMTTCNCNNPRCKHRPLLQCHLHTSYSALDGSSLIDNYIKLAKEYNHPGIAITDHGNFSGSFEFFQKCKAAGLKPIIGMEAYLNDNIGEKNEKDKSFEGKDTHQSIIIKNREGYVNLNKLTYLSFTEGYYRRGRITTDWLIENKSGLIITTSCMASKLARFVEEGKEAEAEERLKLLMREFGDDLVAELQFNEIPAQKKYNHFILRMIKKHSLMPIIAGDVHYSYPEDNNLQDVVIAINQHKSINDPKAFKLQARQLGYHSFEDYHRMNKEFGYNYPEKFIDDCLDNSLKILDKCNFEFETGVEKYPKYEPTIEVSSYFKTTDTKEIITKLAHAKLKQKTKIYQKNNIVKITPEVEKQYVDRLNYELKVIDDKKMLDYFMIVWELIKFCKENNIEVGPGRGSACGCLLTWCLDITKIDSLRFDLFFERFLNPTRKGAPDLDIDFEAGTDEKTLNFLYEKFGKNRVLPVITFSRFNEKGAIKDVCRALGYDTGFNSDVAAVTKEMPHIPTWDISLEDWFKTWPNDPECSEQVKSWLTNPNNQEIIQLTLKLQGQIRGFGKHAAGITIFPSEVWNHIPINISKGQILTGFMESGSSKDLSELGYLKLDRLKLETLNVIKDAIKLVKEHKNIDIQEKVDYIDIYDENLYKEILIGENQGIFQFESSGMNNLLRGIKVNKFDELVASSALYRPGPMGVNAHTEYIENKFAPDKIKYVHESLKPILEKTNGVLIYQEQLMQIANQIAGLSLGNGDGLRKYMDSASKIIGKNLRGETLSENELSNKNYKAYLELWAKFIEGAKNSGISERDVKNIEEWLIKYLGYSFNKCLSKNHTVCSKTRGKTKLLRVKIGEEILCYNPTTRCNEYNKVLKIHRNGLKQLYKVITKSGKIIECTLDHKILTKKGMLPLKDIFEQDIKIHLFDTNYSEIYEDIEEIIELDKDETYDLEIDSEFHNYYANNICVSNSHSLSYTYISCQTLFLKHYYPTEFYAALLNHPKSTPDKDKEKAWLTGAILAAMSKGIEITYPNRKSNWEWTVIGDKKIAMGYSAINGIGAVAFKELQEKKLGEMTKDEFFTTKFSKFNKGCFEACLKAGLFDDWSHSREELIELRKIKIKDVTQLDLWGNSGISTVKLTKKFLPTTDEQKHLEFMETCNGIDLQLIRNISKFRNDFFQEYNINIDSAINFDTPDNYYYFILENIEPRASKRGRKFYSLTISDGAVKKKVNMWEKFYQENSKILNTGSLYISKFTKERGWLTFNEEAEFRRILFE